MTRHRDSTHLDDLLDEPVVAASTDDAWDDDWLAANAPRRRISPISAALIAGIVLAVTFLGGVMVQKANDEHLVSSGSSTGGAPGGFPNVPGGSGGLGGQGGSATGTAGGGNPRASASPVAIGTLTSEHRHVLTIKNLAGKTVMVKTKPTTTLIEPQSLTGGPLPLGRTLSITGNASANGTVTAATITVR